MTTPDPLRAALEEATNWIDTAASNDVPEAYKLVDQLHLALAADTAPPTTPDTLRAVTGVLMRAGLFRSVERTEREAVSIVRTVRWPHLRWDIDDDHLTPEHYAALATDPAPLDVGRAFVRPEVAAAFDRAALATDTVCQFPGCGLPRRLHGAPPGKQPNPTRSTHDFRAALADTAPLDELPDYDEDEYNGRIPWRP